jgi:type II secretion system protein N
MLNSILNPIFSLFKFHKKKVLAFVGLFFFFLYLLFPFNDLGDLVTSKISEGTNNQAFVNFDNIDLALLPHPSLVLTKVSIETPFAPTLIAKSLSVSPSFLGLISFHPGVNVEANGVLGGNLDLTAGLGEKTMTTPVHRKQKVSMELDGISLGTLAKLASSPLRVDGQISGSVIAEVDPEFAEQLTGEIDLKSEKTVFPEANIMGMGLPKLNLGDVIVQGQADKGQLDLTSFVAGHKGGDLYVTATGKIDIRMQKQMNGVMPPQGGYDLIVNVQLGDTLRQKLGPFLSAIQAYQTAPNNYAIRLSAPYAGANPSFAHP